MFGRKNKHSKNPINEYTKILNICKSRTNLLEKLTNIDRKLGSDRIQLIYEIGLIRIAIQQKHILVSTTHLLNTLYSFKSQKLEILNKYRKKLDDLWHHIQNNFEKKIEKLDKITSSVK